MRILRTASKVCSMNEAIETITSKKAPYAGAFLYLPQNNTPILLRALYFLRIPPNLIFTFLQQFDIFNKTFCMPALGKHNISRTLWRFLEIFLFFVVSVLGYNFLAKTSSFSAKSKSKETFSRVVAAQYYSDEDASMLSAYQNTPLPKHSSPHSSLPFYAILQQTFDRVTSYSGTIPAPASTVPIVVKANLFLHHQVLII